MTPGTIVDGGVHNTNVFFILHMNSMNDFVAIWFHVEERLSDVHQFKRGAVMWFIEKVIVCE